MRYFAFHCIIEVFVVLRGSKVSSSLYNVCYGMQEAHGHSQYAIRGIVVANTIVFTKNMSIDKLCGVFCSVGGIDYRDTLYRILFY